MSEKITKSPLSNAVTEGEIVFQNCLLFDWMKEIIIHMAIIVGCTHHSCYAPAPHGIFSQSRFPLCRVFTPLRIKWLMCHSAADGTHETTAHLMLSTSLCLQSPWISFKEQQVTLTLTNQSKTKPSSWKYSDLWFWTGAPVAEFPAQTLISFLTYSRSLIQIHKQGVSQYFFP